ncbi:MAG: hypothetical protein J4F45_10530 [Pseudomonadales bacterium]|nr:hypothetical protein [Pseudomonadales bacterium]
MTAETWTIIGTAIAILIAIAASNRSLRHESRTDIRGLENRMNEMESKLTQRINDIETKLTQRINDIETKLTQRIDGVNERITVLDAQLRERLGRVEGMLDVIRDSIFDRRPPEPERAATQPPRSSAPP